MAAAQRTVHRYWHGEPTDFGDWTFNVLSHLGHSVVDWSDDTLPHQVLELADRTAHLVVDEDQLRHRANVVRWWLLDTHGGWWADHDLVALRHFAELPFPATAAHQGIRCTSWLGFPAGHPVPAAALAAIAARDARPAKSRLVSGEQLLERICTPDVAAISLPIDPDGRPEGPPWAVHLYANRTMKRGS